MFYLQVQCVVSLRLSWLVLFVVLVWAITEVVGCSVALACAVCGACLGYN